MRLFRRLSYRVLRGEQTGAVFERLRGAVREIRQTEQPLLFLVEDYAQVAAQSVRGVARIKRKFPQLERYEFTRERALARRKGVVTWQALSNVSGAWPESNPHGPQAPVEAEVLAGLAAGVPRRFPVSTAAFLFDRIDWAQSGRTCPEATARYPSVGRWWHDYLSSSAGVRSEAGASSGRDLWVEATVEIEPPASGEAEVLPLDSATRERLGRLGNVQTEQLIAAPSEAERQSLAAAWVEAERLVEKARQALRLASRNTGVLCVLGLAPRRGAHIRFPFKLGAYENRPWGEMSFKPALLDAFGPRGYTYATALRRHNTYVFLKRTPAHHRLRLDFSTGVRGDVLRCDLAYEGPFFRYRLELCCSPWQLQGEYPVRNQDVLTEAAANYAAVVDHLESTLLPALEGLYGRAPQWFEYEGDRRA